MTNTIVVVVVDYEYDNDRGSNGISSLSRITCM